MEMKSAKSTSKAGAAAAATPDVAKLIASGDYVFPVSIVGSQAQRGPYLPGLKDQLIGVTFLRLAEQISTPALKASAQRLALELIQSGTAILAGHVAKQRASLKK